MADYGVEGGALKKLVKAAKSAPVAFGFNPGKGEEDAYLGMHRNKSPEVLGKDAKDSAEGGKFAFGTATLLGKEIQLRCDRVLPGLAKRLKKYLKTQKVMLNVVIMDADGNVLESDIEDNLPEDPDLAGDDDGAGDETADGAAETAVDAGAKTADGAEQAPDNAAVLTRLGVLRDDIKTLAPEVQAKLAGPFKQVVELARAMDVAAAEAGATRIEQAIAGLKAQGGANEATDAPVQPDPQLQKLAQMVMAMRTKAEALADARIKAGVMNALEVAAGHIKAKDVDQTVAILKKLQEIFKSQEVTAPTATQSEEAQVAEAEVTEGNAEGDDDDEDQTLSPEAQEWEDRYGAISGDVFLALSQGLVADVDALRKLNIFATGLAADAAYAKALDMLPRIEAMLKAGREDGKSAFEAEVPPEARPFADARVRWAGARVQMQREVQKVTSAIIAAAAEDDSLDAAARNVSVLTDKVATLDSRLEDALDLIVNAEAGVRDPLKSEARKLIATYEAELSAPFFADIDNASGFGSVAVTATARAALTDIARVLA